MTSRLPSRPGEREELPQRRPARSVTAPSRPGRSSETQLLALQRSLGNAAVVGLLNSSDSAEQVQRLSLGSVGKRLKSAGRAALFLGRWPIDEVQMAISRLRRNRATKKDVRQVEEIARQMGYEEEVRKPAWARDGELLQAISHQVNEEAIERGLTINFDFND